MKVTVRITSSFKAAAKPLLKKYHSLSKYLRKIFNDFKLIAILLLLIIAYTAIKINHHGFIPDFFQLAKFANAPDYFQLLLNVTASIFGILITVTLLTFQLLIKDNPLRNRKDNLLNNTLIITTIALPISIVILCLYSYLTITDFKQSNNLTICYFLGILFIAFIIFLYWAIKKILSISDTLKKAVEEINSITIESINEIIPLQNEKFIAKESTILLVKIRNRLAKYVKEGDYETYNSVLSELSNKIRGLINKGKDRKLASNIFQAWEFILEPSTFEALRVNDPQFYISIWDSVDSFYEYAAKNQIQLLHLESLSSYIRTYLSFLITNKLSNSLSKGAKVLTNAYTTTLTYNCPKQENIIDFSWIYDEDANLPVFNNDMDSGMQWMKIQEVFEEFAHIYFTSIELSYKELYQECFWLTKGIIFDIQFGSLSKLGSYQERNIIESIFNLRTDAAIQANQKNLFDYFGWTFNLDEITLYDFIENEKIYVKYILRKTSDCLIKSQEQKKVNNSSYSTLGGLGRLSCQIYQNNRTAKKAIKYILNTFVFLKGYIEKTQLPSESKNYVQINSEIKSLKHYLNKFYPGNAFPIINEIDSILATFKVVDNTRDYEIVPWQD